MSTPIDVPIRDESIRLGQLLKLAGVVDDGAMARELVERGVVAVNGEVDTRRGRQVRPGDVVTAEGETLHVTTEGETLHVTTEGETLHVTTEP